MTLARDGLKEMIACTVVLGGMAALASWAALRMTSWFWLLAIPLAALWLFSLLFFRVPSRVTPSEPGLLVSPADGRVTEITSLDSCPEVGRPALRISIFLSVFDVHVNRSPCDGTVQYVQYCPGEFLDARHPECGIRNESNTIALAPKGLPGPIVIRQIAGLIARRIVCHLKPEENVERGQLFGMIKFGSRTEIIVPQDTGLRPVIAIGDHVKGGSTILLRPIQVTQRDSRPVQKSRPAVASA